MRPIPTITSPVRTATAAPPPPAGPIQRWPGGRRQWSWTGPCLPRSGWPAGMPGQTSPASSGLFGRPDVVHGGLPATLRGRRGGSARKQLLRAPCHHAQRGGDPHQNTAPGPPNQMAVATRRSCLVPMVKPGGGAQRPGGTGDTPPIPPPPAGAAWLERWWEPQGYGRAGKTVRRGSTARSREQPQRPGGPDGVIQTLESSMTIHLK